MDIKWPEQTYLTINTFINDCRWFSVEKLRQNFGFRGKNDHFDPQISPLLSPGDTQSNRNHTYLDVTSPEQTSLTIDTFINAYRWFSVETLRQNFWFRGKTSNFLHPNFAISIIWEDPEWHRHPEYGHKLIKTNLPNNLCCFEWVQFVLRRNIEAKFQIQGKNWQFFAPQISLLLSSGKIQSDVDILNMDLKWTKKLT